MKPLYDTSSLLPAARAARQMVLRDMAAPSVASTWSNWTVAAPTWAPPAVSSRIEACTPTMSADLDWKPNIAEWATPPRARAGIVSPPAPLTRTAGPAPTRHSRSRMRLTPSTTASCCTSQREVPTAPQPVGRAPPASSAPIAAPAKVGSGIRLAVPRSTARPSAVWRRSPEANTVTGTLSG